MLNPTLIQQFNSAPHALFNDAGLKNLQQVLSILFPDDITYTSGDYAYYFTDIHEHDVSLWTCDDTTTLPIIPVTAFFQQPDKMVKVSDVVAWVEGNAIISISDTERLLHHIKQYLNELP